MTFSICKLAFMVSVPLIVLSLYGYREAIKQVGRLNRQIHEILESQSLRYQEEADAHRRLLIAKQEDQHRRLVKGSMTG